MWGMFAESAHIVALAEWTHAGVGQSDSIESSRTTSGFCSGDSSRRSHLQSLVWRKLSDSDCGMAACGKICSDIGGKAEVKKGKPKGFGGFEA
ncbi:hypothetical protein AXG93_4225s1030 [Marchantia polymorpha subsp. ruderalis]|uniref:Uncharacterized protein n=1 Tax=Marchantia polymorpha subsp. ruderalis TaxID=1480154 RepID=A0A176WRQ9_MARPO|nr:hypothetical protein AXG93_4225s1030 [Marchantia polymorpha subsp. ruderalis]